MRKITEAGAAKPGQIMKLIMPADENRWQILARYCL
jgi:hypothetical protein